MCLEFVPTQERGCSRKCGKLCLTAPAMSIYVMVHVYFVLQSSPHHRVTPGVEKHMVAEFSSGQGSRVPLPVLRRDARQSRRRLSRHGVCALGAIPVPAVLFPTCRLLLL